MVHTLTWKYRRSCNHFDIEVIISGESFHPLSLFAVWHWTRNDRKISFIQNSGYSSPNDSYGTHNLLDIITIIWLFQMPEWGYFINNCLKHWKFRIDAWKCVPEIASNVCVSEPVVSLEKNELLPQETDHT